MSEDDGSALFDRSLGCDGSGLSGQRSIGMGNPNENVLGVGYAFDGIPSIEEGEGNEGTGLLSPSASCQEEEFERSNAEG